MIIPEAHECDQIDERVKRVRRGRPTLCELLSTPQQPDVGCVAASMNKINRKDNRRVGYMWNRVKRGSPPKNETQRPRPISGYFVVPVPGLFQYNTKV